jgi:F0F1-type ATP synthase assembly protein I
MTVNETAQKRRRARGAIFLVLAVSAIGASVTTLHGRPASVSAVAGGLLLVLAIAQFARRN